MGNRKTKAPKKKTVAYLRVSTLDQDTTKNKAEILNLANDKDFGKVEWFEEKISGKRSWKERQIKNIIDDLGEGFFSMSEADIAYPTKEDHRKRFTEYLNATTFTEYTSLMEPEIGFSDDGSIAWGNYKVKVSGSRGGEDFSFDCAWLWLFRRVGERWMRIGEVSTWK